MEAPRLAVGAAVFGINQQAAVLLLEGGTRAERPAGQLWSALGQTGKNIRLQLQCMSADFAYTKPIS